jgi:hypothetical protein
MPKPKIIDRRGPESLAEVDAAGFAEKCADSLLRWVRRIGVWGDCDEMNYWPATNQIVIGRKSAVHGRIESSIGCFLHETRGKAWIPCERKFVRGRDRDVFCYLLGVCLIGSYEGDRVPDYILSSPDYIAAAERLIQEYREPFRHRIIGWLRVDPEALSVEAHALVTESALKYP